MRHSIAHRKQLMITVKTSLNTWGIQGCFFFAA